MKTEIETGSYNERRYGKPWIAKVDFDKSGKTGFTWGNWVGNPGQAGILVIDANPGDILARGQKDHRGNNNEITYFTVKGDGTRVKFSGGKAEAYRAYSAAVKA